MLNAVLYRDVFFFTKVKESNVFMKLINLKSSKATGLDNIPLTFLKDSDNFITPTVTHKINLSIGQGKVPDELKQARVIPLFKKGSRLSVIIIGNFECFI